MAGPRRTRTVLQEATGFRAPVAEAAPTRLLDRDHEPPDSLRRAPARPSTSATDTDTVRVTTERTVAGPQPGPVRVAPGWATPVLVLLAALAILEGYRGLDVIPSTGWQPSSLAFVAVVSVSAVLLSRAGRHGHPVRAVKVVVGTSSLLLAVTVVSVAVGRLSLTHLVGAVDLLFAASALVAVALNERRADRPA